jgi:ribosomal protein S12 methylthiotransferase
LADVPQDVKDARWERLMEVQQDISIARVALKVGRTLPCIIDEVDGEGGGNARSQADAPEIDGAVYLRDVPAHVKQGDIVNVLMNTICMGLLFNFTSSRTRTRRDLK